MIGFRQSKFDGAYIKRKHNRISIVVAEGDFITGCLCRRVDDENAGDPGIPRSQMRQHGFTLQPDTGLGDITQRPVSIIRRDGVVQNDVRRVES